MAIKTYPLNDIEYQAEDAELFHCTRTSGVYASGHFPVSVTGADNNITIGKGIGWLKNTEFSGKVFASKEETVLNAGVPDASLPRVDAVVVRFDANQNETYFTIKQGSVGSTPTTPAVERNEYNYELHLYHIRRRPGATAITPGDITDLRMDANYCGLMADSVTQVDMSAINAQIREFITDWENQIANVTDGKMIESPEYPGCYYRMNRGVKEWLNPPMMEDVEYPTTKRQDGKRVYTKLLKARSHVGSVSLPDVERIVSVFAVAERDWNGEKLMFQLPVDSLPKDAPTIQKMQVYYHGNHIEFESVTKIGLYNLYITVEYTKSGDEVAYTNVTADCDTVYVETNGNVSAQGDNLNVEMFTTVSADGGAYIRRLTINGVAYDLAVGQAGNGAPGTASPGVPGQFYTDLDSGEVYVCMGGSADAGVYIWNTIIPPTLSTSGVRLNHKTGVGSALITANQGAISISNGGKDAVVRGVANPVNANDASNKQYVDEKTTENWSGLKWYVLGDSLTDPTGGVHTSKFYYEYIQEKTGIQAIVDGLGGTGYYAGVSTGTRFADRVMSIPDDVDIVTIFGSGNDVKNGTPDGYGAAMAETMRYFFNSRPGLPVIIVPPSPWATYNKRSDEWKTYCDRLELMALNYSLHYLGEMWTAPPFDPNSSADRAAFFTKCPDGIHPDENGHRLLASYFYEKMRQVLAFKTLPTIGG